MAKTLALIASALCVLALAGFAQCQEKFTVEGRVYCDTCRLEFVTRLSKFISGAKVKLECRDRLDQKNVTYTVEGLTNAEGHYTLPVEGDHELEICEVIPVSSPDTECNEVLTHERARISLAKNSGITSDCRFANDLAFLVKKPLPECTEVLKELTIVP